MRVKVRTMIFPVGPRSLTPGTLYRLSALPKPNERIIGDPRFLVPDYVRRGLKVVAFTSDHLRRRKAKGLRLSLWVTVEQPISLRGAIECESWVRS